MCRHVTIRETRRTGAAPLELVMGLPFLLGTFAMLLTVGFVSLKKGALVVDARREVWSRRDDRDPQANGLVTSDVAADRPLSITGANDETAGRIYGETEGSVRVFRWLGQDHVSPRGRAAVLAGSWDHRQIDDFERRPPGPHLSVLEKMIGGTGAISNMAITLLGSLGGGIRLENQSEIDQAQQEAEKAGEEARKARDRLVQEIERLKKELEQLQEERQVLVDQRQQKQAERSQKASRLAEFRRQAGLANPVPPSLQRQIAETESDIRKLDGDIAELDGKIRVKDGQISAKREELRQAEENLNRYDQESANMTNG